MKPFTCVLLIGLSIISNIPAKAQTTILSENFSGDSLPSGWSITKNSFSVGWQFGTSSQAYENYMGTNEFDPASIGSYLAFDLDLNNNDIDGFATEDRLITPALDLSGYSGANIYVKYDAFFMQSNLSGQYESFTCEASTDNGNTWTVLQTLNGLNGWQNKYVDVSSYAGQSNVEFCFHYNDGHVRNAGVAIGDIQIFTAGFIPLHTVTFEEATGTWCSWCVRGIVYQDSIEKVYPNTAITIAIHDKLGVHPMTDSAYDVNETSFGITPGLVFSFPSIVVDRMGIDDPDNVFSEYNNHIGDFGVANVSASSSYNATTRTATINAGADFAMNATDKYNLAVAITEDSVMGNDDSYNQNNVYSGGGQGIMGDFQNLPDPVPYNEMYYMFVARDILSSYTGTAGSIDSPVIANTNYTYQYNYTVPDGYNAAEMKATVLLLDAATGVILNATSSPLISTGIDLLNSGVSDINIFPNPLNNNVNLSVSLTKTEHVNIILNDILGRTISSTNEGTLSSGTHNFVYNASALASGIYMVTIKTGDEQITRKIVK
jgi:hypothetical protein